MVNVTYNLKIKKGFYSELNRFVGHHMEYILDLDTYTGEISNATLTSNNDDNTDVTINFDFDYDDYTLGYSCDYNSLIDLEANPEILDICNVYVD